MNIMAALVLGLLIGWLIEWVIDWFYWRRPAKQEPLDPPAPAPIAPPPPVVIQPAVESLPPVEAPKRTKKTLRIVRADNLKKIKGIGPAIEKRLNEAGVKKYEQLAALTAADLKDILGDPLERLVNKRSVLREARELAKQKAQGKKR